MKQMLFRRRIKRPAALAAGRHGAAMLSAIALGLSLASHALAARPGDVGAAASGLSLGVGGELHIDVQRTPRSELVRQLAMLTGAELRLGNGTQLDQASPLTLKWRGRDVSEAWQLVLGPSASHALQCVGLRCRVWLLSLATATGPAIASPARTQARQAPAHLATTPPASPPPAAQALPPMRADPPGLFPSE